MFTIMSRFECCVLYAVLWIKQKMYTLCGKPWHKEKGIK